MAAAAGKRVRPPFLCSLKHTASKYSGSFLPWPPSIEQKEFGLENGGTNKKKRGGRQIQEVQTWNQVRGPAGAVMCETCELGVKWQYWHTLVCSDEIKIDMRFVCPKDV